jgi:hypothetical protein
MEYLNLVNRIMEAERSAQDLVREAQERRPAQEEDLRREVEGIHTASMEHARSQVAEVEKAHPRRGAGGFGSLGRQAEGVDGPRGERGPEISGELGGDAVLHDREGIT